MQPSTRRTRRQVICACISAFAMLLSALPLTAVELSITFPPANTTVSGVVPVQGECSEDRFGYIIMTVDGKGKAATSALPLRFMLDTSRFPDGKHELEFALFKDGDELCRSDKVTIIVNNSGLPVAPNAPVVSKPGTIVKPASTRPPLRPRLTAKMIRMPMPKVEATTAAPAPSTTPPAAPVEKPMEKSIDKPMTQAPAPAVKVAVSSTPKSAPVATILTSAAQVAKAAARPSALVPRTAPFPVASPISAVNPVVDLSAKRTSPVPVVTTAPLVVVAKAPAEAITTQAEAPKLGVFLDGKSQDCLFVAYVENGRAMVMLRPLVENAGGSVEWDGKQATALINQRRVVVVPGSDIVTVNGTPVMLDRPTVETDGHIWMPATAWRTAFGGLVEYDPTYKCVWMRSRAAQLQARADDAP